jgi:hypothetical protein
VPKVGFEPTESSGPEPDAFANLTTWAQLNWCVGRASNSHASGSRPDRYSTSRHRRKTLFLSAQTPWQVQSPTLVDSAGITNGIHSLYAPSITRVFIQLYFNSSLQAFIYRKPRDEVTNTALCLLSEMCLNKLHTIPLHKLEVGAGIEPAMTSFAGLRFPVLATGPWCSKRDSNSHGYAALS